MTTTPEDIPQANQLLYTIKLNNSEELLCTLVDVDEENRGILIESPIVVVSVPVMTDDGIRHQLSSRSWMPFSEDRIFFIRNSEILTMGRMAASSHALYVRLVNQFETKVSSSVSSSAEAFVVEGNEDIH